MKDLIFSLLSLLNSSDTKREETERLRGFLIRYLL